MKKIEKELETVWADLNGALKKANKQLESLEASDHPKANKFVTQMEGLIEKCEKDKFEVEHANRWKKLPDDKALTLGNGQDLQARACQSLSDLIDCHRASKVCFDKVKQK